MASIQSKFEEFLSGIRLTQSQIDDCEIGHQTLRDRLEKDEDVSSIIVGTFLQGSYRRHTAIKPCNNSRADVDVVVVTNLNEGDYTPQEALDQFKPFLKRYYNGKFQLQGRSWGIELSYVDLDLVVTSAPSEAAINSLRANEFNNIGVFSFAPSSSAKDSSWKSEPLRIPDREAKKWDDTHPLRQIEETQNKNAVTDGCFVNVVKAIKWWRKSKEPTPKYPKSYPLEHLLWANCPDEITSVAEGVVRSLEAIRDNQEYIACIETGHVPFLPDHGVPNHNVLARVSPDDFNQFYNLVVSACRRVREAYDESNETRSQQLWFDFFGPPFPKPDDSESKGGYTPRIRPPESIPNGRFG